MRSSKRSFRPGLFGVLTTIAFGLLGGSCAFAQTSGDLPLVSVGDALKWVPAQETYTLRVSAQQSGSSIGLEVFSPGLNLGDYANGRATSGYYGDELYERGGQFETTFTLSGPGGTVLERRYRTTDVHAWDSLFAGALPAGTYTLNVTSKGNGKNAFALRTAPGFALEASEFTVNARGRPGEDLVAARLSVPAQWVGQPLEISNYDADDATELGLAVVLPNGTRRSLVASGNNVATTDRFEVTPELVGDWTILTSVPAGAKQYSNAVTLRLAVGGQGVTARLPSFTPPSSSGPSGAITVEIVDERGRAVPGASYSVTGDGTLRPRLPAGYLAMGATVLEGSGVIASPTEVRLEVGRARVRFVVRGQEGTLSVDAVAVWGGQRVALTGIPLELAGRTVTLPATVQLPPADYTLTPTLVPGANAQAQTVRVADGTTARVTLEYVVRAELSLLASPDVVDACGVTQLTAIAKTDFPYRLASGLRLELPVGWASDYPLVVRGDMSASAPLRLRVPVRVCRSDTAEATLEGAGLLASGEARVRPPSGANLTRIAGGTRVRIDKNATATQGGYLVTLQLSVDAVIENLRIIDPLPSGGATPALRGPLNVQGPSLAGITPRVDGDSILLGRVTPGQYTVTYTLFSDIGADRVVTLPDLAW